MTVVDISIMIKIKLLGFNQQVTKPTLNVKSIKRSGVKYEAERFIRPFIALKPSTCTKLSTRLRGF